MTRKSRDPHAILKERLRVALRGRRRTLASESPQAAFEAAVLMPLSRLPPFQVVAGYHPLGAELDPGPLMARLAEAGATLALPVALDRESPLVFRTVTGELAPDALAIPAPPPHAAEVLPDIVIAPVLAFDAAGGRLGQGAGHYDRTLAALRARKSVFVLGLAYAGQEVAHVPSEPHDQHLDAILTEMGYRDIQQGPPKDS
jgi:5-formyltetrahydrofolate cyclo-ligase